MKDILNEKPWKIQRPKGLEKFLLEQCINIVLYDKTGCFCMSSGKEVKLRGFSGFEHNREEEVKCSNKRCKFCNDCRVLLKKRRYGRAYENFYTNVLWTAKKGKTTFVQIDEAYFDYQKDVVEIRFNPLAQYKFNSKEQMYYTKEWHWGRYEWFRRKRIVLRKTIEGFRYTTRQRPTFLYPDIKLGSDLKYATFEAFSGVQMPEVAERYRPEMFIGYINRFLKYQSIELLEKAGFYEIIKQQADHTAPHLGINIRGKSLQKIFGLSKKEIKDLPRKKDILFLQRYKILRKIGVKPENIIEGERSGAFLSYMYRFPEDIEELARLTDINKAIAYIVKTREIEKMTLGRKSIDVSIYLDYLKELDFLGCDMKDKRNLYPKNFHEAHMEKSEEAANLKSAVKVEKFKENQEKITEMTKPFEYKEYLIRPAESPDELADESQALNHCVRSYVDRVAAGETSILFIRKKDEPEKPLYTLELSKKKEVIQCRGYQNGGYGEDVKEFIEKWKGAMAI